MNDYIYLALASLGLAAAASFVAYGLAIRRLPTSKLLQSIGEKLHHRKMASLERPPLSWYRDVAAAGRFAPGYLIIAAGILLKSVVCGILGMLVIFYIPLGVAAIPALAAQHGNDPKLHRWVANVTMLQTTSHLLAACVGFAASWYWLRHDGNPLEVMGSAPTFTASVLAASLVTGLWAAWVETDGHIRRGYLHAA